MHGFTPYSPTPVTAKIIEAVQIMLDGGFRHEGPESAFAGWVRSVTQQCQDAG